MNRTQAYLMTSATVAAGLLAASGRGALALVCLFAVSLCLGAGYQPGPCLHANTLTNLVTAVVQAFDIVSREVVGFIPSVNRDPKADRVAKNQTMYSWAAPAATLSDVTPGAASPTASDKTFTNKSITISNYKMTDWYFTGEEENALAGPYGNIVTDLIEQGIRAIINQQEADIWTAAYVGASRAYGTAGTTPFASSVADSAQIGKILTDNGAPAGTRSLIIDTSAGAALKTLAQLTKANEAGTTMTLRDGELLNLNGLSIKESGQIASVTAGTGASYQLNGAHAVGATTIAVDTGSGTILAGDILTIGNHKYVVTTALSGGSLTIGAPGLRAAHADNVTVTVNAASTRNIGFSRNAILLASRLCALPSGGDIASDRETVTDARSGIAIELAMYPQYRQVRYELSAAWGVSIIKPEHIAVSLG